jgi:lipid A 3-O-deacylase
MQKKFAAFVLAAAAFLSTTSARAVDSVSLEVGQGHGLWLWRAGAQWNWREENDKAIGDWYLRGYWDVTAGTWEQGVDTLYDAGVTPVFRLERSARGSPYLEAAIGLHMLSSLDITPLRTFSSHLQFGDHIGFGVRFGHEQRLDFGVRLQHLSNAGLRNPNPGINFLLLRLQYHFQ